MQCFLNWAVAAVLHQRPIYPALFVRGSPGKYLTDRALDNLVLRIIFETPQRQAPGLAVFFLRRDNRIYIFFFEKLEVFAVCVTRIA